MREAAFYGGAHAVTLVTPITLSFRLARIWRLNAVAVATIEDARKLKRGTQIGLVLNVGAGSITVRDGATSTIVVLASGHALELSLLDNSTAAGVWAYKDSVINAGAVTLALKRAYVVGGTGTTTRAEYYNHAGGAWVNGTAAPNPKVEGAAMPCGGRAWFVGVYPIDANSPKNDELQEGGTWVSRTACTFSPGRTMGAGLEAVGYVFGAAAATTVAAYGLDAWTAKASLPIAMPRGTAKGMGDRIIIAAGEPQSANNLGYLPVSDVYYTAQAYSSVQRHSLSSFRVGAKFYIAGGINGATVYASVDEYNQLTNSWATKSAMGASRYGGCGFGGNARGYYAGGNNSGGTAQTTAASYVSDTWTNLAALGVARAEVCNTGASL